MNAKDYKKNIDHLDSMGIFVHGQAWDDKPYSAEVECYTDAGEDMCFCLEELSAEGMMEYVDSFDINEQVVLWWPNGRKAEGMGVPFNNIVEHYQDYEKFLERLSKAAEGMV